jgi:nicotinate-nucleotide adenylyltransferase
VTRIGLLGGTLDPIHCGHLAAAVAARDALDLTDVLVIPSRIPPHRPAQPIASAFHRFAMACLAVSNVPRLEASDDELRADGPSYTADTLERLAAPTPSRSPILPSQIFFITGVDAFADIATWKRYPGVLDLANFVVVARPGHALDAIRTKLPSLAARMRPASQAGAGEKTSIYLLQAATPDVSSTQVRERLRRGEAITGLVPPLVEQHILKHGLYSASPRQNAGDDADMREQANELHGQNREN